MVRVCVRMSVCVPKFKPFMCSIRYLQGYLIIVRCDQVIRIWKKTGRGGKLEKGKGKGKTLRDGLKTTEMHIFFENLFYSMEK